MTAAGLKEVPFKATADRMMTLGELCDLVAGRVPLLIELKSRFDGDLRLAARAAEVLQTYAGPVGADVVRSGADRGAARDRARPAARHRGGAALRATANGATLTASAEALAARSCCTAAARGRISSPTTSRTCPPLARGLHATCSACRC